MSEPGTTYESPPESSVDDMAEELAKKLSTLTEERDLLRSNRVDIVKRLKYLDAEIDKAERMTKALIPRHRRSLTKPVDQ